jgi:hypothetical protein
MQLIRAGSAFTRKSLKDELRKIRDCYNPGDFVENPEHVAFLTECLREGNHANGKPEEASERWFVHLHEQFSHDSKCFAVLRDDGSADYPSLDRLSGKKVHAPTPKEAGRLDVKDQTSGYKEARRQRPSGAYVCEDCGRCGLDGLNFEVHHVTPFVGLWEDFASVISGEIEVVETKAPKLTFGLAYPINVAFRVFHEEYAELQVLCDRCHRLRTHGAKQ